MELPLKNDDFLLKNGRLCLQLEVTTEEFDPDEAIFTKGDFSDSMMLSQCSSRPARRRPRWTGRFVF